MTCSANGAVALAPTSWGYAHIEQCPESLLLEAGRLGGTMKKGRSLVASTVPTGLSAEQLSGASWPPIFLCAGVLH